MGAASGQPVGLTVGQVARRAGLSTKAVRHYEARGLLPAARRSESGYRLFTDHDLAVLHFIRQAKALGLHLAEIKDILDLERGGTQPCTRVTALLDARITEIDRTVAELRDLRRALAAARAVARDTQRRGEHATVCRIIETEPAAPSSR